MIHMELLFTILFAILPPCAEEDSSNCRWDADNMGNGTGTSFVALHTPGTPDDLLIYEDGHHEVMSNNYE
jgi:hypothetical protein